MNMNMNVNNNNTELENIILSLVKENPNDYDLGERIRHFANTNLIIKNDPNQMTISFDGHFEDVDETEDSSIDVGNDVSNNLSVG